MPEEVDPPAPLLARNDGWAQEINDNRRVLPEGVPKRAGNVDLGARTGRQANLNVPALVPPPAENPANPGPQRGRVYAAKRVAAANNALPQQQRPEWLKINEPTVRPRVALEVNTGHVIATSTAATLRGRFLTENASIAAIQAALRAHGCEVPAQD